MDIPKCPYCSGEMRPGALCCGQHRAPVSASSRCPASATLSIWPARICSAEISSSRRSAASNADPSSYDMRKIDLSKYPVPLHRIFFTQKL